MGPHPLSDFEEIDRYKLKPEHVFDDLFNVQKITEWNLEPENTTALMVDTQNLLPIFLQSTNILKMLFLNRGEAYLGLASDS